MWQIDCTSTAAALQTNLETGQNLETIKLRVASDSAELCTVFASPFSIWAQCSTISAQAQNR